MDTSKVYSDSEGNECSIWQVVKREPTWAAVRIQEGEKAIDEIAALRQRLEQAEVRVAELEELAVRHMAGMISLLSSKGVDVSRQNDAYMSAVTGSNTRSWLLQKQAEAVEKFGQEIGVFDPEYDDQEYVEIPRREVKAYTQRLRQQADKLE